jgi:hypothetical protein
MREELERLFEKQLGTLDEIDRRCARLERRFDESAKEMHRAFARSAKAIHESMMRRVGVVDDKYKDLPRRVARLELKVLAPKRTPRR